MEFEIDGQPVPWSAHKGFGRRSFNPKFKEREFYQWKLKQQYMHDSPLETAIKLNVVYHMNMPTSFSKTKRENALLGRIHHVKRPDLDNLNKFLLDCMKTVVFKDDSQVVEISCSKKYSEKAKTNVVVISYNA